MLKHIRQLVEWLDHASECDRRGCGWADTVAEKWVDDEFRYMGHNAEIAKQTLHEFPLSLKFRSVCDPCNESMGDAEFCIPLDNHPACRIVGELNKLDEPVTARIEYHDWGTPWTEYPFAPDAEADLLRYCQQFYFGS